ncbi:hypothetical protein Thermus71318_15640 [Thermus brockianus]
MAIGVHRPVKEGSVRKPNIRPIGKGMDMGKERPPGKAGPPHHKAVLSLKDNVAAVRPKTCLSHHDEGKGIRLGGPACGRPRGSFYKTAVGKACVGRKVLPTRRCGEMNPKCHRGV